LYCLRIDSSETLADTENQKLLEDYQNIMNSKFWGYVTSKSALIRKSSYRLLTVLCTKLPSTTTDNFSLLYKV
jgi:hypothetical protein